MGLFCLQRANFEVVPGCAGGDFDQSTDYCFQRPVNYLWRTGNNGSPVSAYPMNACDGDCDRDADCAGDLECFERDGSESVPGCDGGGGTIGEDYCYDPNPGPTTLEPTHSPTTQVSRSFYS